MTDTAEFRALQREVASLRRELAQVRGQQDAQTEELADVRKRLPQPDADPAVLGALLEAAHATAGADPWTACALIVHSERRTPEGRALREAISGAVDAWPDGQVRRLGIFLARHAGEELDGLRLLRLARTSRDGVVYKISRARVFESQESQPN